ncbi:hypothetical protein MGMO_96c00160 [Methyloglobulus morosus KoM1]|uniref:DUF4398 domain-containing protein n=2 Tax=Methyloglobulus TaxID=1410680 RepID=V5BUP7_9GAMM|nr:hypothetical protein MGMO_96c00160 [Methyloglobulus morosus KoM1]
MTTILFGVYLMEKKMKDIYNPKTNQIMQRIALTAVTTVFMASCAGIPAPTEQMAVSKVAVSNATSAGGNEFAPLPLKSAMEKMDGAERAMAAENYLQARQLAEEAQVDAQLAATTARSVKAQNAARALQEDNRVLRQEIDRNAQ